MPEPAATVANATGGRIEEVVDIFDRREKISYNLNSSCNERFLVRAHIGQPERENVPAVAVYNPHIHIKT